jgi:hypothetical protein
MKPNVGGATIDSPVNQNPRSLQPHPWKWTESLFSIHSLRLPLVQDTPDRVRKIWRYSTWRKISRQSDSDFGQDRGDSTTRVEWFQCVYHKNIIWKVRKITRLQTACLWLNTDGIKQWIILVIECSFSNQMALADYILPGIALFYLIFIFCQWMIRVYLMLTVSTMITE